MKIFLAPALLACCFFLSGCSEWSSLWRDRYGPPAIYEAEDVASVTQRQIEVLRVLADGAGMIWPPPSSETEYWYKVTLTGFNVVDDQCSQYLEDLFGWERKRNRTRDVLALGAASAATVLGITNAGQKSLVLTAQAFGFATGAWTIVADSYLYKLSPSTIMSIEQKLQAAFRVAAEKNKSTINNGAAAYQYLRGYLNLCLPVTIENKVAEYLAQTKGEEKPPPSAPAGPQKAKVSRLPTSLRQGGGAATPDVGLSSVFR